MLIDRYDDSANRARVAKHDIDSDMCRCRCGAPRDRLCMKYKSLCPLMGYRQVTMNGSGFAQDQVSLTIRFWSGSGRSNWGKSRKQMDRYRRSRRGQILPILALIVGGLLAVGALGIDVLYMYWGKDRLQNGTDASALAGATYLTTLTFTGGDPACTSYSTNNAQNAACTYALSNGVAFSEIQSITPAADGNSITVSTSRLVPALRYCHRHSRAANARVRQRRNANWVGFRDAIYVWASHYNACQWLWSRLLAGVGIAEPE